MEHISDSLKKLHDKPSPKSQRAHLIQRICDDMFSQDDFKKILGQTSKMTTIEIQTIFDEARSWNKNPQALFWKLVKDRRLKIKKQVDSDK